MRHQIPREVVCDAGGAFRGRRTSHRETARGLAADVPAEFFPAERTGLQLYGRGARHETHVPLRRPEFRGAEPGGAAEVSFDLREASRQVAGAYRRHPRAGGRAADGRDGAAGAGVRAGRSSG